MNLNVVFRFAQNRFVRSCTAIRLIAQKKSLKIIDHQRQSLLHSIWTCKKASHAITP